MATRIVNITLRLVSFAAIGAGAVALVNNLSPEDMRRALLIADVTCLTAICAVIARRVRG